MRQAHQHHNTTRISIGTLFSGTDAPVYVLPFVLSFIAERLGMQPLASGQLFACECAEKKRKFLMDNFDVGMLFEDAKDMASVSAPDFISS